MTRIIIADDHTLFRIGLKQMLESFDGVSVVAEAANAAQTLDVVQGVAADLLVSDLTMPGTCGTQLIEQLHRQHPSLPILILSMHDEPATVRRAKALALLSHRDSRLIDVASETGFSDVRNFRRAFKR